MAAKKPALLSAGTIFDERYEIVRCIGKGGMGAVYEVLHLETKRRRALKVLLPSKAKRESLRNRLKREATVVAGVASEHIADVFDAGVEEVSGAPYIVMELLKGEELAQMLSRRGTLPPDEVVLYLWQASLALEKTHAENIVHRDLKPENLFVTYRDDGSPCVKLLDFGIAKVVTGGSSGKTTKGVVGTVVYLAPEQIRARERQGPRTDTYALGQIVFTLLTGKPYWQPEVDERNFYGALLVVAEGSNTSACERAAQSGVELPAAFDTWFAKATAVDPQDRFGSARELVGALAEVFGVEVPRQVQGTAFAGPAGAVDRPPAIRRDTGSTSSEYPSVAESAETQPPRASPLRAGLLFALVAVALIAVVLAVLRGADDASSTESQAASASAADTSSAVSVQQPLASQRASAAPSASLAVPEASASASAASTTTTVKIPRPPPTGARPVPTATSTGWTPPVTER